MQNSVWHIVVLREYLLNESISEQCLWFVCPLSVLSFKQYTLKFFPSPSAFFSLFQLVKSG